MTRVSEIAKALKEVVGAKPNLPFTAKVVSVEEHTCTVLVSETLEIPNVKLRATSNPSDDYLLMTPKVGSKVTLLSLTGSIENLVVINIDTPEKIHFNHKGLLFEIDGAEGKVSIKKDDNSMLDSIVELLDILKNNFKVYTSTGASGTALPDTKSNLSRIEQKFKTFLK